MKSFHNVAAVCDRRILIQTVAVDLRATEIEVASRDLAYARSPGQQVVRATQGVLP